jgi:hypothetical protein
VARQVHYCGSHDDPLDYRTEHAGTGPSTVIPREDFRFSLAQRIKEDYGDVEKGK